MVWIESGVVSILFPGSFYTAGRRPKPADPWHVRYPSEPIGRLARLQDVLVLGFRRSGMDNVITWLHDGGLVRENRMIDEAEQNNALRICKRHTRVIFDPRSTSPSSARGRIAMKTDKAQSLRCNSLIA